MKAPLTIIAVANIALALFAAPCFPQDGGYHSGSESYYTAMDETGPAGDSWNAGYPIGCNGAAGCQCPSCRHWSIWGSADYLMWWTRGRSVPPLVTTSPTFTPRDEAGVLGFPTTSILFGGEKIGDEIQSGARLELGAWLDEYETVGLGGRAWGLEGDSAGFFGQSTGDPVLARPFFNVTSGLQDSQLVAYPSVVEGNITAHSEMDILSAEAFLRVLVQNGRGYSIDFIGGYHFTRIDENLSISDVVTSIDPQATVPVGTTFDIRDTFETRNEFHGGELGFTSIVRRGCWTFNSLVKLSFGNMHETVFINGSTVVTVPDVPSVTSAGGLLTQPSNIGVYERDQIVLIPEVGVWLGYQVSNHMRLTFGYTFVYWSRVALAGDQIDTAVNLTQAGGGTLIGEPRPAFTFRDTEFWAQGMNFGVSWHY